MIGLPYDKTLMIAVGGMSGSGKSTLAYALQKKIEGSVVLDPDELRKRMFGVSPQTPLPDSAYSPENTQKFIAYAHAEAERHLKNGHTVIVSGLFLDHKTRAKQEEIAKRNGAQFVGLYLHAPLSTVYGRVVRRRGAASDADLKVVRRQARQQARLNPAHDVHWHIILAKQEPTAVLTNAVRCIGEELKTGPVAKARRRNKRNKNQSRPPGPGNPGSF